MDAIEQTAVEGNGLPPATDAFKLRAIMAEVRQHEAATRRRQERPEDSFLYRRCREILGLRGDGEASERGE